LGWLNLEVEKAENFFDFEGLKIEESFKNQIEQNLVLVPDSLISQIINSNLEVRTSVSIDPITGAAKEGALFTSEAIPRATVFYGTIRVIDRAGLKENSDIPSSDCVKEALKDSRCYFQTLGIGGMTTRGFGRMSVGLSGAGTSECETQGNGGSNEQ
jgi:CRISPR-associated protein Cmr4